MHNLVTAKTQGHEIELCWVPSHVGINGNAIQAGNGTIKQVNITHSDCVRFIQSKLAHKW